MNSDLFLAVLSMDSYNRGYGVQIAGLTGATHIGNAQIGVDSAALGSDTLGRLDEQAGFYALSYEMDGVSGFATGDKVIAYRGTDSFSDDWETYLTALGHPDNPQTEYAIQFYKQVFGIGAMDDPRDAQAILTGHSLGGGLAGYVAGLYGVEAVIFDPMPYRQGVEAAYDWGSDPSQMNNYTYANDLIYNSMTSWQPDYSSIYGYYIPVQDDSPDSNNLAVFRESFPGEDQGLVEINLPDGVDLGTTLENRVGQRHSISLSIIQRYGDVNTLADSDWGLGATYVLPALFDQKIGEAIFAGNTGLEDKAGMMRDAIAYSVIDEGERPFGDVAIKSLYHDTRMIGSVIDAGTFSFFDDADNVSAISRMVVHYSGLMAFGDVTGNATSATGIIAQDGYAFGVNISRNLWHDVSGIDSQSTIISGFDRFAEQTIGDYGFIKAGGLYDDDMSRWVITDEEPHANIYSALTRLGRFGSSADSTIFGQIVILSDASEITIGDSSVLAADDVILAIGGDHTDRIFGSSSDDFIIGGSGNDKLNGGEGTNLLIGGDGVDAAEYDTSSKPITVSINEGEISVKSGEAIDYLIEIESILAPNANVNVVISDEIPEELDLTIHSIAAARQVINFSAGNNFEFNNSNGLGYIRDLVVGGSIDLIGFHTSVIGSEGDDIITDIGAGTKRILAGDGNDEISVDGASVLVDGGSGDDSISGGSGNDVLVGGSGANVLIGGAGSDQLISSSNGDTLDGGEGHDLLKIAPNVTEARLIGGAGNDVIDARLPDGWQPSPPYNPTSSEKVIYEFGLGGGHDVILAESVVGNEGSMFSGYEYSSYGINEIYFNGINKNDVSFVMDITSSILVGEFINVQGTHVYYYDVSAKLAIVINSTGDSVYLDNVVAWGRSFDDSPVIQFIDNVSLPVIRFEDGILEYIGDSTMFVPTLGSVTQYNTAYDDFRAAVGSTGHGPINGTSGNDLLTGGSGDEEVSAGAGDDEIEASGGSDEVNGGDGIDQLTTFGSIVGFTFERQIDGSVIVTSLNGLEGRTKIVNVEKIYSISDDETSDLSALAGEYGTPDDDILINGTTRADFLYGLGGDDTIRGGGGDDVIDGGDGSDTANYLGNSSGYRIYNDVDGSVKVVDLSGSEGTDKLLNAEAIHFAGDNVTILSVSLPALGTTAADVLSGDGRANHLFGLDGDDVLDGGIGNDILQGGEGSDTYAVMAGGGNDIIIETPSENFDEDVIDLTAFNPEDITFLRGTTLADASELFIKINATGEITRVQGQFADFSDRGVERLDFASSVSWDRNQIAAAAVSVGTGGADVIYGSPIGGTINGNGGDDVVHSYGSDTILYHESDGDLEIRDEMFLLPDMEWSETDTLHLVDLEETDVTFFRSGRDLIINVTATGNEIVIKDQSPWGSDGSASYSKRIELIQFATGSAVDIEPLFAAATALPVSGTAGGDHLVGTFYDDEIHAGGGDDTISGLDGVDILDGGSGNDTIGGGGTGSTLIGGTGDDTFLDPWGWGVTIDGGDGTDIFVLDSKYGQNHGFVYESDGTLTVNYESWSGPTAIANLKDVEQIKFLGNNVTISTTDLSFVGNPAPELSNSLWDQDYQRGDVLSIEIPLGAFTDPNDATLTYTATLADGSPLPSWLTLTDREFAGTVPTAVYGPLGIIVTASDGENSVSDQFTLFIGNPTTNEIYAQGTEYGTSANDLMYADGNASISLYGDDGDDTIIADADEVLVHGEAGNDVLQATGLNIELEGGAGYDQFVFDIWSFNDLPQSSDTWATILDFEDGIDKVGLYDSVSGFGHIANKFTQVGNDVVLAATNLPKIIFKDTDISDLDASDFQFTPAEQQNPQQGLFSSQPETLFL